MTQHKDMERAERELDNWLAGEGREDFITGIASLIAQVRKETSIDILERFAKSFSECDQAAVAKLLQDGADEIRNLKQEDKE